jgi:predicted CoA-binding protein
VSVDTYVGEAINQRVWAIVGASNDRTKYGNRIYRDLRGAGYTVYAVNPNDSIVEGDTAYPRLQDLPEVPDVVDVVVPASVGARIAYDAQEVGAIYFWLQPGAESPDLIRAAADRGLRVIHNRCAMVEKRRWEE